MHKFIVLITNIFPYSPGEEFLETEVKYWASRDDVKFIIMPKNKTNTLRKVPESIQIDYTLIENQYLNKNDFKTLMKIFTNSILYKEIFYNNIYNLSALKYTLIAIRDFIFYKEILKKYIQTRHNKEIIFYTYWHTETCYAIQSLKQEFNNIKVISRIHGFDLYQERREYNYMPLKQQFLNNIDKIYTISNVARDYIINTYGYNQEKIDTARLGVEDKDIITLSSEEEILHIVSCSYMNQVKRIDKIIESLYMLASKQSSTKYIWTHIGDGKLYNELVTLANYKLNKLQNVEFKFIGHLDNKDVYKFYQESKIDVFLNVSKSEGVPVTIMEAMSCHIPIVAPNIGGISEMVINRKNGFLLSSESTTDEIVSVLLNTEFYKNKYVRDYSYELFLKKYNAYNNYKLFINKQMNLGN